MSQRDLMYLAGGLALGIFVWPMIRPSAPAAAPAAR
jgi:hypothetical protein